MLRAKVQSGARNMNKIMAVHALDRLPAEALQGDVGNREPAAAVRAAAGARVPRTGFLQVTFDLDD